MEHGQVAEARLSLRREWGVTVVVAEASRRPQGMLLWQGLRCDPRVALAQVAGNSQGCQGLCCLSRCQGPLERYLEVLVANTCWWWRGTLRCRPQGILPCVMLRCQLHAPPSPAFLQEIQRALRFLGTCVQCAKVA